MRFVEIWKPQVNPDLKTNIVTSGSYQVTYCQLDLLEPKASSMWCGRSPPDIPILHPNGRNDPDFRVEVVAQKLQSIYINCPYLRPIR
jgi:hypothetical protein